MISTNTYTKSMDTANGIERFVLLEQEIQSIRSLIDSLAIDHKSTETAEFIRCATAAAQELPRSLRSMLLRFRYSEPGLGSCIVSGYPVDDSKLGLTPTHWRQSSQNSPSLAEEIYFFLLGSILGDVFGWATQQDSQLIHNIIPVKEHVHSQISSGSKEEIWWHTEDAFHEYRGDYVGLMCLRNPDDVPTTMAIPNFSLLTQKQISILFEPRFFIRPDDSHVQQEVQENLIRISVMFGDPKHPYLRLDPYFMESSQSDEEAQDALEALIRAINTQLIDVVLNPGDVCFIDNYKAVHGRRGFTARFDGSDRWLKRVNITRDIRKSRHVRSSTESRIIA